MSQKPLLIPKNCGNNELAGTLDFIDISQIWDFGVVQRLSNFPYMG